jgi:uncharacterized protein with FMN-binding domain
MNLPSRSHAFALLAAVAVAAPLAGCAADAASTPGAADLASGGGATSDTYTDGTYTEPGSYQSPLGLETIEVTLTLAGSVITDVTVVGLGDHSTTRRFQGEFIGGIADAVVGENIDEIVIDRVAGSSLTSGGFEEAVGKIKADALA